MKYTTFVLFVVLFTSVLVSCATPTSVPPTATPASIPPTATPTPVPLTMDMIEPGDMIGDMLFTTFDDYFFFEFGLDMYCDFDSEKEIAVNVYEIECQATAGDRVFFGSCAGVAGNSTEELDSTWAQLESEVTFDDQVIDLPPFGPIDFSADGYFRVWNLVVENISAGTHTVHCINDGYQSWESTFYFTVAEYGETYPTLPSIAIPGQHPYTSGSAQLDFLLYIPDDYGEDPGRKWPLILFLHGYPKGLAQIDLIRRQALPKRLENEDDFPFIVVSPHRDEGYSEYWRQDENVSPMFLLLEEIQTLYSVDPRRIYLSGSSGGGNGVWEIGLQYPERFAALVPVMGHYGYPFEVPDNICDLKDVPIWAFHGAKDEEIPLYAEQGLVDALEACGGNVQFTIYPDAGHDIADQAYGNSELYTWLLEQMLK